MAQVNIEIDFSLDWNFAVCSFLIFRSQHLTVTVCRFDDKVLIKYESTQLHPRWTKLYDRNM